jgi:hypothetical protein
VNDFQLAPGFEEVWQPPVRTRQVRPQALLGGGGSAAVRTRIARVVNRAPEVMVKVTGRTRDPGHLRAHLDYISRNGALELEGRDGAYIAGRDGVRDVAAAWSEAQLRDRRSRHDAPFSHGLVLSMPAGTDPLTLRDAARAFAEDVFAGGHDYVFTLHTDTPRPHVHLSICSRGDWGQRLNPKKADLESWRQIFAERLRERGVEAEATPRRTRGVTRKAERGPLRHMRERYEARRGPPSRALRGAYVVAARAAFGGSKEQPAWEHRLLDRQRRVRATWLAQARLLQSSADAADRSLGARVEEFVRGMPQPDSQRLALARELRTAHKGLDRHVSDETVDGPSRERLR